LRPLFYKNHVGVAWPFSYCDRSLSLLDANTLSEIYGGKLPLIPMLISTFKSIGVCQEEHTFANCKMVVTGPTILDKVMKETSQGTVYFASVLFSDKCGSHVDMDIRVVVKVNEVVEREHFQWVDCPNAKHVKGIRGVYRILSKAYIDAYCSMETSKLVEQNVSPHFPLCYGTTLASTTQKRTRDPDILKNVSQMIWMEYIPYNMCKLLQSSVDYRVWWSALFQANASILAARFHMSMQHNDCGCHNFRATKVPYDAALYYQDDSGRYYRVFTYGYIFKMTDFGRALVEIRGKTYVSSEFDAFGDCPNSIPDNTSFDLHRLCNSVEDKVGIVTDLNEQRKLRAFFKKCCSCDDPKRDLLKEMAKSKDDKELCYLMDHLPREICHNAEPYDALDTFYSVFGVPYVPSNVTVYKLSRPK
jgi:hypothetical protein